MMFSSHIDMIDKNGLKKPQLYARRFQYIKAVRKRLSHIALTSSSNKSTNEKKMWIFLRVKRRFEVMSELCLRHSLRAVAYSV